MTDSPDISNNVLLVGDKSRLEANKKWRATRRTNSSYYTRLNAEWIKPYLDRIYDENLKGAEFGAGDAGCKPTSLHIRILQGWNYLCDHMDPESKYRVLRERCVIRRHVDSVEIFRKYADISVEFKSRISNQKEIDWRKELLLFIEDTEQLLFIKENLVLAEFEITDLNDLFQSTMGTNGNDYRWQISREKVKIVKNKI